MYEVATGSLVPVSGSESRATGRVIFTILSDPVHPPLFVIALVPGREASTEMNGYNKYFATLVAIASAATIGVAGGRAAAVPSPATATSNAAQGGSAEAEVVRDTTFESTPPRAEDVLDELLAARPHLIDDAVADAIVRLAGPVCTGTPITATVIVITAAHCVLTTRGEVTQRTVVRNGIRYPAVAVLVNTEYADHPREEIDAAVLIMAQVIPGPSAQLGIALPTSGEVALAGFQPIDSDGSLLRGHGPDDHPRPKGATGTQISNPYEPAGCVVSVDALKVSAARVTVPCGLIPGASGGPLFTEVDGRLVLVGILSTVTADQSTNFIVPLAAVHELLAHPELYAHGFSAQPVHHEQVRVERS